MRRAIRIAALLGAVALASLAATTAAARAESPGRDTGAVTPVQHLVVIFQENVSFDHYFATYPKAANPAGEPEFTPEKGTPTVNGLNEPLQAPNNPNLVQPFRLDRSQFQTSDQDHNYTDEQRAADSGLMDMFVEKVGRGAGPADQGSVPGGQVMGYYDGNTVTALWNYAQSFAMSDNSFDTIFGPSSPGAINLVSGQTHGAVPPFLATPFGVDTANGSMIGDPQPAGDICDTRESVTMTGSNIGNLLNQRNLTWGWFQGGFRNCTQTHTSMGGVVSKDYIPHHEPFQYYPSTANPLHLPPLSPLSVGHQDQANHQYDMTDFYAALDANNLPAVSFVKAPAYQDGHAGYSNPLDEQRFVVQTINRLELSPFWHDTAVVIAYDDSDGWYDHVMSPIVNQSQDPANDALSGVTCGNKPQNVSGGYQDRCGYGPRQPLLVVSPYAKENFVDHTTTDQTSVLRFIEDNWLVGRIGDFSFDTKAGSLLNMFAFQPVGPVGGNNKLFLDPDTGQKSGPH
ncbi:MAG: phospholipase [Gaiellaceae bacterium]|jgi:phospholipase C|nr:phospholipase [Gaiellaceae bacterium]